ncbi:MAG: 2-oxo acid dehydrogenase subunit E2 [Myxococcales bacterium]|nr:2-oxo acid dehydrogenase subunit E2 [Myxococcales bacterium]
MAQFYEMPAISPTMELGTIVAWRIPEGATFESGAVMAEVGTDKANMDAEIFDKGVLIRHLVAEGDEVPPGYPIAIWGTSKDEDITGLLAEFQTRKTAKPADAAPAPAPAPEAPAPAPPPAAAPVTGKLERTWMGKPTHLLFSDPPGDLRFGVASAGTSTQVAATPLARKVAAELGVDLELVKGSGPGGRVTEKDVRSAPPKGASAPAARPSASDETVRNTPMRKTIARRLLESHQLIPTFFLTATFDAAGFVDLRADLKDKLPDLKVSYNDLMILAVARSLREHPEINASWGETAITRHGRVDIGVAVALPDGLITPVLRAADTKSLRQVASEVRELATRARAQKLAPEEYTGGTFTISNLGMMDIEHFTAIINPPEAAILAVGSIVEVPVVAEDGFEVGHRMKVTMTCDHRVIDGAMGAAFLQTLRKYVESPWLLIV